MAEATPVTEESTMNRSSSHQIVSELQVAEIHLKTNVETRQILHLVKKYFLESDLLLNQLFHSNITDHNGNKLNFTGQLFRTR